LVVEERVYGSPPPDRLVKVRENPDMRKALDVLETAAMRLRENDARRAREVRFRLQRHPLE